MARQVHRIIVEGMDGSGKTTLVKNLNATFPNLEIIVNEKHGKQDFNTWWPKVLEQEQKGFTPLHDRFFYSELIYGPIIRGRINAESILISNVMWFLRAGSLLIYARPDSDRLRESSQANPQMEGVHDKFNELLELYDQLMAQEKEWFKNRFIHYVWHRPSEFEHVTELVRAYLNGGLE